MVAIEHTELDTPMTAVTPAGALDCTVVPKPFFDPKKSLAATS